MSSFTTPAVLPDDKEEGEVQHKHQLGFFVSWKGVGHAHSE